MCWQLITEGENASGEYVPFQAFTCADRRWKEEPETQDWKL